MGIRLNTQTLKYLFANIMIFSVKEAHEMGPIRKHSIEFYDSFDPRYNQYEFGPNYLAVKSDLVKEFKTILILNLSALFSSWSE